MPSFFKAIAITGFIAGTLDLTAATIHFITRKPGYGFSDLLARIASGAIGSEAFKGGLTSPILGFFLHYFIAYSFVTLFFVAYGRIPLLRKQPLISGLLYGIVVWSIMQFLVLPLSKIGMGTLKLTDINTLIGIAILMLMIGVPAALGARFYYRTVGMD